MKGEEHVHDWGPWSGWNYAGYSTEMRTRYCGNHADAEYRQHSHDWVTRLDPFAPVGCGITMRVCRGCGETTSG